jgi:hypothetical protein
MNDTVEIAIISELQDYDRPNLYPGIWKGNPGFRIEPLNLNNIWMVKVIKNINLP